MNLFSDDRLLQALADVYYPGRSARIGLWRTGGSTYRLLAIEGRPVTAHPFYDFVQPLEGAAASAADAAPLGYLPHAALATVAVEDEHVPVVPAGTRPAPYVDFRRFPAWADYEAFRLARGRRHLRDSANQRRRLAQDLGPIRFEWDDRRPETFATLLEWKSAQYVATGLPDMFKRRENVRFFEVLLERGVAVLSSLWAGDRRVAMHLGAVSDERLFSWVPAYDVELAKHGPGRQLFEDVIAASYARGHREFDFLIGGEQYKYRYATHQRLVGEAGTAPASLRMRRAARSSVRRVLGAFPPLLEGARAVRRRLAERGGV